MELECDSALNSLVSISRVKENHSTALLQFVQYSNFVLGNISKNRNKEDFFVQGGLWRNP